MVTASYNDGFGTEDNAGQPITIADIIGMVKRRWLLLAIPIVIGVPISFIIAQALPSIYVARAEILVESQQIPTDLARSTVEQSAAERIQLIRQRLTTRENVLRIAEQYNVYANRPDMSQSDIVTEMRRSFGMRRVAGQSRGSTSQVVISFRGENPVIAARVANEFVSQVVSENVEQRTGRARMTLEFFNSEVERLNREIDAQAARVAQFRAENQDALPDTLNERIEDLRRLRERQFEREIQALNLADRRRNLEQAIAQVGDGAGGREAIQQQLRQLRNQFILNSATLSETHPRMRLLRTRITSLERLLAGDTSIDIEVDDPDQETDPEAGPTFRMDNLAAQMERLEKEEELFNQQREAELARIEQLELSIERTPEVTLELNALQRGSRNLQNDLGQALQRLSDAETGSRLETNQQAERFEVIEQAVPNNEPVSPNRRAIGLAGSAASAGFGLFLMVAVEFLNRCIRTVSDLERQVGLRPIVAVPYIRTEQEKRRQKLKIVTLATLVVIAVPISLLAFHNFVVPLPIIAERLLEASGVDWLIPRISRLLNF